jgi:hypothetical protein
MPRPTAPSNNSRIGVVHAGGKMEQSGVGKSAGNALPFFMEHRWGQRMPCRARVQISGGTGLRGAGRVRDISLSGAFIETALSLPLYVRVELIVQGNESATHAKKMTASVSRVARDGVGIEWCESLAVSVCDAVGCATRCAALSAAYPRT